VPRGFFLRVAIEKFFNQVGTHLLRTGNLAINKELNDARGAARESES
jgi:hypothetical protein